MSRTRTAPTASAATPRQESAPPRRRAHTREQLILAAEELFIERGSLNIPIEAITERAGFTRGAFYSSFSTIDELLLAVFERRAEAMNTVLAEAVQEVVRDALPHDLTELVQRLIALLPIDSTWFRLRGLYIAQASTQADGLASLARARELQITRLRPLILNALAAIQRVPTIAPDTLVLAFLAAFEGASSAGFGMGPDKIDELRILTTVSALRGLTTVTSARAQAPAPSEAAA